jgi:uncharacterized surface protein with fasciclin (FAS1) repeats
VNVDWQPCGHKDIIICHGESHYDFHLYYLNDTEINHPSKTCIDHVEGDDIHAEPHEQIMCMDDDGGNGPNHQYFRLMADNMPQTIGNQAVDYCVDHTSAIPKSGIHYGDVSETNSEWMEPVTIMGSHDCELTFFEPMISWGWISNYLWRQGGARNWPHWQSGEIVYNDKTLKSLPTRWEVKVSAGCDQNSNAACDIQINVYGEKCPDGNGCRGHGVDDNGRVARRCGTQKDCSTNQIYASPSNAVYTSPFTYPASTPKFWWHRDTKASFDYAVGVKGPCMDIANYHIEGNDRTGRVIGTDPTITMRVGDTMTFQLDGVCGSHPLRIKTGTSFVGCAGGCDADNVDALMITGQQGLTATGELKFTPTASGSYHYECSYHSMMIGLITVLPVAKDIAQVATDLGGFGTLLAVATSLNLVPALKGAGPLTVLAPTDAAFAAISLDTLTDAQKLTIVQGHIISGNVKSSDLSNGAVVNTLSGSMLTVGISGAGVVTFTAANGGTVATVATADVEAMNGVIHAIDTVLIPGTATQDAGGN